MVKPFSAVQRETYLQQMNGDSELDILVIGGGITGAGIALDATTRGLSTGLVEMQDFAAGTSSRSTKLVHGGLRYLKQLEFKIVAEVGKERAIVYENAPHVTNPEWMLLPIIKGGTYGKLASSVGLKVYDFLAGVKRKERRNMLSKQETIDKEPLLKRDTLKGSGIYVEYKTDDARLTLEILKEAVHRGTTAVNYAKAETLIYDNGKVAGARVKDLVSGKTYDIRAKKVINAAGPWVDDLREKDNSKKGKYLHLTKGVHIVIDQSRFPLKQAVYFDTKDDGRMVFAIPRDGKTYVGTTDTHYTEEIDSPRMTEDDLNYLINATNYMFPTVQLKREDVESSWAGLRPLIHEEGKSASEISRKDEIFESQSGLLSIAGGKLTGYRKMAERIVDIAANELGIKEKSATEKITLSGGDVGGADNLTSFIETWTNKGKEVGLSEKEAKRLTSLYGSNVKRLLEIIETSGRESKHYHLPESVFASLVYGIEEEMVVSPIDFFNRRTSEVIFDIHAVHRHKEGVMKYMKDRFHWSDEEMECHEKILDEELYYAAHPIETRDKN
ncbi:glycerol-3-phosphate dehydrogenase/oxidase [Salipaludibacillus agaradhaerens]|uniref:glycerol-3-phosphate dehydrogenase/oxidase n=1 Tax=Salipaludibacillus agaradhaerens TaxID=76935 RepID=UPI0021724FB7|nr:glycerol-3-phosphate dehydrogenase/oxidase [Salipaludibacillus agaradhaerens]MCR6106059.1 glycerol-3-phosphate dehydrogenase/oxidase [Salipaludibacillus agaradhaerens]MCR6118092.1 glycerol-3-phosphate dehydrogenase/oxidase [Salipaludibacillus agaradhaerens]UJW57222.1 glycerol-3-phosphate dehydrogenase/oxidase [Bacillus sp. A116_S68]